MEKRKILSVLIAVCMVLSLMPAGLVGAFALGDENDPIVLTTGKTMLNFEETDEYYCAFTPAESGPYVFAAESDAESDMDSAVFLYDSEDNLIASADDWVYDDTTSRDFCLLALLEAEETYTLVITADTGDAGLSLQGENPYELTLMVVNVDFKPLVEGENEIIYDEENYNNTYYFVPEVSGDYSISSTESGSFEIYDETNNIITSYEDEEISVSMAAGHIYVLNFSTDCEISIELSSAFLSLAMGKNTVTEITLDDDDTGEYTYYTFTPEESGSYRFASVSVYDSDPYAYLYSLQKERLAENDDAPSEHSNNYLDFSVYYTLEAGKTYLLVFFNYEDLDPYDVYIEMINPTEIFLGSNELEEDDTLLSFTAETTGYYSFCIKLGKDGKMYDYRSSEYADYNTRMSRYMAAGESFIFRMAYGDLTEEDLNMVVSYSGSCYSLIIDESLDYSYLMFLDGYYEGILPGETVYFMLNGNYTYPDLELTVSGTEDTCEYTLKTIGTRTVCSFVMPAGNVIVSATPVKKDYNIAAAVSDINAVWINSNSFANAGDTVFFEAGSSNTLFEIDSITVSYYENDEPVEVDYEDCGDYYSFVMPAANVSILVVHGLAALSDVPAFTLGENTIDDSAGIDGVFTFTPEESGTYEIVSAINSDPKAYLYNDSKEQIDSDDDDGLGYNFRIKQYLDAGKTYYIYIEDLDEYTIAGTVTIRQASAVETVSHALVLSGEIGVIFNIFIDENVVDTEGSYIEFSTGRFGTQRVYTEDTLEMYSNDFDSYYSPFVCFMGAYRMADEITPVFHWFDGDEEKTVELDPYSAQDYINYVFENSEDYRENEYRLVEAINDYGYYSQQYLSELHGYTIGADGKYAAVEDCCTVEYDYDEILSDLSYNGYNDYELDKNDEMVEKVSFSLNLESDIDLYLYITVKDGVVPTEVKLDGIVDEDIAVLTQYSENVYRVVIKDIKLSYLADYFNIVVKDADDNELISASISPLNYVYLVLDRYGEDADKAALCNAVCALAACYNAIEVYLSNQEIGPMP